MKLSNLINEEHPHDLPPDDKALEAIREYVRENLRKYKTLPLAELLNKSINETLSRTVITSVTTLLALLALYFLGGEVIKDFSFAMIWGVLIGTYSSIYVAANVLLLMHISKEDLMPPIREGEEVDSMP